MCPKLNWVYFIIAIGSQGHPALVWIPWAKWSYGWWQMAGYSYFVMLQITVIAEHFVQPSTYMSPGNTQPQVLNTPDFVQLTIHKSLYTSFDQFGWHFGYYSLHWIWNINVLCKLSIVILHLPSCCRMAKVFHPILKKSIQYLLTVVTCWPLHCDNLPVTVSTLSSPMFWWTAKNLMTKNTNDSRTGSLLNSTEYIKSQSILMCRVMSSNKMFRGKIHCSTMQHPRKFAIYGNSNHKLSQIQYLILA